MSEAWRIEEDDDDDDEMFTGTLYGKFGRNQMNSGFKII